MALSRIFFTLILCLFSSLSIPVRSFATDTSCDLVSTAMNTASRLRGLSIKKQVPCKLQDKNQVKKYLEEAVKIHVPQERIANEERVFKFLGIIPQDFDYVSGIINLYTDQLGGYYDPAKKYYAMAAWMPALMQMPIAVHELTHALQDQYYELDKFTDQKTTPSDALLARSSLIEGDATAVMIDYTRELQGQGPIAKEDNISFFMLQNISGALISSAGNSAPQTLQTMMIFPYISGLNFVHSLLKNSKKNNVYLTIDKAFKNPPKSTEEILHPDKYLKKSADFIVLPTPIPENTSAIKDTTPAYTDTLGEFMISTMLSSWISPLEASNAATGWGGDTLALYELKSSAKGLLLWDTNWDSKEDAQEFFNTLTEAYEKRFSKPAVKTTTKSSFAGTPIGTATLELKDKRVLISIGR